MRLVVATGNAHKQKEIKRIFSLPGLEVLAKDDFSAWPEWEETGADYYENALIKAKAIFQAFGLPAIADDSGLEVDHLRGRPGLFSARYSGLEGDYQANNDKLLGELRDVPRSLRTARFVCVALCLVNEKDVVQARGVCEGHIALGFRSPAENRLGRSKLENAAQSPGCKADEARDEGTYVQLRDRTEGEENAADGVFGRASNGAGGFGYDPIFIPRGHDRSMAELSAAEKDVISHRGNALTELADKLETYMSNHVG